jgi:hypothetical protein
MKVTVLKSFPYAHDGLRTVMLQAGTDQEIRDELVSGLVAAGNIEEPKRKAPATGERPRALFETAALSGPVSDVPSAAAAPERKPKR